MTSDAGPNSKGQKNVEVRVYGSPKRLLPEGDTAMVALVEGETVKALLRRLNIPDEDVWLVVVNEVVVSEDFILSPGDKVGIMSPVSGG
ncbi:MAG: MoaD/ThiS family protein [Bacillota bacterium]